MNGIKQSLTEKEAVEVHLLLLEIRGTYEQRSKERILPDGYREYCEEQVAKINRLLEKI